MQSPQEDYVFKIVLIGSQEVGKSSILLRFSDNSFSDAYLTTIGVDFKIRNLDLQGKSVKLEIWDTAGQERFRTIVSSYYKNAHGIILTYDITNKSTFKQIKNLLTEVEDHAGKIIVLLLVGNKSDLETERKVTFEEGKALADSLGIKFVECSAKSNTNLDEVFMTMTENIMGKQIIQIPLKQPQQDLKQSPQEDYVFKLLLIGSQEVGKRFSVNSFSDAYLSTIGVDFKKRNLDLKGKSVKLEIWDTAGQERFKNIVSSYYNGAQGIILTYDITNKYTFEQIKSFLKRVEKHANKDVVLLLIGNKSDLETERKVTFEEGKALADSLGIKFVECSAKSNTNVDEVFMTLAEDLKAKQITMI